MHKEQIRPLSVAFLLLPNDFIILRLPQQRGKRKMALGTGHWALTSISPHKHRIWATKQQRSLFPDVKCHHCDLETYLEPFSDLALTLSYQFLCIEEKGLRWMQMSSKIVLHMIHSEVEALDSRPKIQQLLPMNLWFHDKHSAKMGILAAPGF